MKSICLSDLPGSLGGQPDRKQIGRLGKRERVQWPCDQIFCYVWPKMRSDRSYRREVLWHSKMFLTF